MLPWPITVIRMVFPPDAVDPALDLRDCRPGLFSS
jgi:hypothetical protein